MCGETSLSKMATWALLILFCSINRVNQNETVRLVEPHLKHNFQTKSSGILGLLCNIFYLHFNKVCLYLMWFIYFIIYSPDFPNPHSRLWIIPKGFLGGRKAADTEGEMVVHKCTPYTKRCHLKFCPCLPPEAQI